MEQKTAYPVNSREWWEEYFRAEWDALGGSEQTRYFMERLLTELPVTEVAFLGSRSLTILDWGCAFGEGVEFLAQAFPESRIVGLDFASTAIEQARLRHPNREFIQTENGEISDEYDVVITSNCLEHFEHPFDIMKAHLRACRELYVALVPYNEFPFSDYHRSQFKEESFPERIGSFVRIAATVIDIDPSRWTGRQLLVTYGSQSYLRRQVGFENKALEQNKWNEFYASLPLFEPQEAMERFGDELVERLLELLPPGSSILEAGCGGGWQSLALARSGKFHVTLMDFSSKALQYARRLFEREELQADFIYGDVFTHGEPQFDLVFNAGVLEHYTLDEQAAFLRGMASRSRNYVLTLVPNRLCYWYWLWRIHQSGSGQWPYGKEVPLAEFFAAFQAAGLKFLGNAFMGQVWAESFILGLDGASQELCARILEVNRSPLVPREQKTYLLAGLGSVLPEAPKVAGIWSLTTAPAEMQIAEMHAALADALALRVSAEHKLTRLEAQKAITEQEQQRALSEVSAQLSGKDLLIQTASSELARRERALSEMSARVTEKERLIDTLSSEVADKTRAIRVLTGKAAETEQQAQFLASQLAAKESDLKKVTDSLGWRLMSRYGRIKYRYLLPFYKALGLPPYGRSQGAGGQTGQSPLNRLPNSPETADLSRITAQEQPNRLHGSNAFDIVCFPIIDWDFRFQRPQQLMSRFAAAGHRVFYISQSFRSSGEPYLIHKRGDNIYEVSLRGPALNVYTDTLDSRTGDELFTSLNALRRDLSLSATAAFVQLPFWWPLAKRAGAEFAWPAIYDCMDYHAGFSTNGEKILDEEEDLLQSADLVIVSSTFLENEARRHNSNVLVIRNACDYKHFATAGKPKGKRTVVGYYGAIADWFDSDLAADLAERRPDWDFVLVGSTFSADLSRLSKLRNVSLPGEKPYAEIPDWLSQFDVAIIPFKRTPLTDATNPVKAYEILAAGKPLVSVPIPEVAALAPLARLASTAKEFEEEIAAALIENGPELIARRRAFAAQHTWERRYEDLAPAVRNVFPMASIIVVTFNNLPLNRQCLESIYARTEWPNFEVIVVDNASSDGTPAYLEEAEKAFPELSVILNDSNLGFAAANNIGLKLARGEYLVLLNNDTVVTRGWVSSLIRHLRANPEVGMVGPVTNAISNEAKVQVGYTQLEEMPGWAADYVREHDGQLFSISTLAMFCVALRREEFEKTGYLDERFGVGMFEDDDYCRRLRDLGYEIRCARDSFIHHWQRASFLLIGEEEYLKIYRENQSKYERKWKESRPVTGAKANPYRGQMAALLRRVEESKGAVIFLPSIGWDIHLLQRPHHLAREFARRGFISVFDSSNSNDDVRGLKEIESNLFLFHGPDELLADVPDPLLWTFPYNFNNKDAYPDTARTVYDWIDDLEVFPYDRAFLERNHRRALHEAHAVVSVARRLHEQAVLVRADAVYLPNGVEYERFAVDGITPPEDVAAMVREGKPIAGYYGALAEWFDYRLLDEVARLRADWNFLLIGQTLDDSLSRQPLLNRKNVKWIGPRQYASLPAYLSAFDVATIPFVINNITLATSPLKLYEYFGAGKAVITTPMPECASFSEVRIVRTAEEFSQALDIARREGQEQEYRTRVRRLAYENSWTMRVQTIEELVGSLTTDRARTVPHTLARASDETRLG